MTDLLSIGGPGLQSIISNESLSIKEKRQLALKELGLKGTRSKYGSKDEAKAARKARSKAKREERSKALVELGLKTPRVKLSKEERATKRKAKGKIRRAAVREWAMNHPDEAKAAGFHPERFKLGGVVVSKPKKTRKKKK